MRVSLTEFCWGGAGATGIYSVGWWCVCERASEGKSMWVYISNGPVLIMMFRGMYSTSVFWIFCSITWETSSSKSIRMRWKDPKVWTDRRVRSRITMELITIQEYSEKTSLPVIGPTHYKLLRLDGVVRMTSFRKTRVDRFHEEDVPVVKRGMRVQKSDHSRVDSLNCLERTLSHPTYLLVNLHYINFLQVGSFLLN